jgi:DNA-binding transcriptional ArsR family regulator
MNKLVAIAKALSDETRIRILKLLLEKISASVNWRKYFPLSTSQLTRNCKMLMEAGFLSDGGKGVHRLYR